MTTTNSSVPRISPVWLVIAGILSLQFGAGVAKILFDEATPTTIVWLRLAASALVLVLVARPVLRGRTRTDWMVVIAFGASLGLMNWSIYQSFSRIPIGIAVTIEFAGPLAVAVIGSRRPRDLIWVAPAAAGVLLLGVERADLTVAGVLFAALAGASWAAYILLSAQTGRRWPGIDGLAMAGVIAAGIFLPVMLAGSGAAALTEPRILLLGGAVAMLSSVIPYSAELIALRSISPRVFGILMCLEPAAAALAGLVVVGEVLSPTQLLAIVFVVVACIGATRSRVTITEPAPD